MFYMSKIRLRLLYIKEEAELKTELSFFGFWFRFQIVVFFET